MITVIYILEDGSKNWTYYMKDLRSAVESIKEDMTACPEIAKAVVFDEEKEKLLEVKNEPIFLIGG